MGAAAGAGALVAAGVGFAAEDGVPALTACGEPAAAGLPAPGMAKNTVMSNWGPVQVPGCVLAPELLPPPLEEEAKVTLATPGMPRIRSMTLPTSV